MGTHPIFESDFDCLTEKEKMNIDTGCDQCYAIHIYLDCLANDMACPLCGRIWRVPGPIPQSQQSQVNPKQQITPILHMCPNDWCSYYVQETPDKDIANCRRLIKNHRKNCIENRKKNKVFHRINKKNGMQGGRFISEDKKREHQRRDAADVKSERMDDL